MAKYEYVEIWFTEETFFRIRSTTTYALQMVEEELDNLRPRFISERAFNGDKDVSGQSYSLLEGKLLLRKAETPHGSYDAPDFAWFILRKLCEAGFEPFSESVAPNGGKGVSLRRRLQE
jgi:hypothetical protein